MPYQNSRRWCDRLTFFLAATSFLAQCVAEAQQPSGATEAPFALQIPHVMPHGGELGMIVENAKGERIRYLVSQEWRDSGPAAESWNLLDDNGNLVPPGNYRWRAISAPPLELKYGMTVAPNLENFFDDRVPWQQSQSGPNGWMADHSSHHHVTALGDRVYFSAPGVEAGAGFIECDLSGKRLWAKHNFGPFTGAGRLASDGEAVYIVARNELHRLDPADHQLTRLAALSSETRRGALSGLAAKDGRVYAAFNSPVPYFDNAALADAVDFENCVPPIPMQVAKLTSERVGANPKQEFLRLLRLTGSPPGQDRHSRRWPMYLESSHGRGAAQDLVIAFHRPVPVGSVVFPKPEGDYDIQLSVLKPGANYPPDPRAEADWLSSTAPVIAEWECLPAPENTFTRAIRLRFRKRGAKSADPLDALLDPVAGGGPKPAALDGLLDRADEGKKKDALNLGGAEPTEWHVQIEGLKILRRRFQNLFPTAKVSVNSGAADRNGVWDGQRSEAISYENPGLYMLQWDQPQSVCGLAIKEIDGAVTEIDVWNGPANSPVVLQSDENWRHVATYQQARRFHYQPSFDRNYLARYLDGYADFGQTFETRAVRLRIVEQWHDNGTGRPYGQREDRGGTKLDTRRCKVWGVAPLAYLGGEPELDSIVYRRLVTYHGQSGEVLAERPIDPCSEIHFGPGGELYSLQNGAIAAIDLETGASQLVVQPTQLIHRFAVGPGGDFFAFHGKPDYSLKVYNPAGEFVREIGESGGFQTGPWNPERFWSVNDLTVDSAGSLWVVENQGLPRRIVQYDAKSGEFVKELVGNTWYGGGGTLNRYDKSKLYYGNVVFDLDWQTGKSNIHGLLTKRLHEKNWDSRNDLIAWRINGRTYLVSAPLLVQKTQPVGAVYLLDDAAQTVRAVAAFGDAKSWSGMEAPGVFSLITDGRVPGDYEFLWHDANGNGDIDKAEVQLSLKENGNLQIGRFDPELGCMAGAVRYDVSKFLPDGTPVYVKRPHSVAGTYRFRDGSVFDMQVRADFPDGGYSVDEVLPGGRGTNKGGSESHVIDADGKVRWRYRTVGSSGLHIEPWIPGYVTYERGVVGYEIADEGDLGEFYVVDCNTGQWQIWTSDGFLAGEVFRHKFNRDARAFGSHSEIHLGDPLGSLTAGQEHFHACFTKSEQDGKFYAVAGHHWISVLEVQGLDRFVRRAGEFTVTPEDVRRARSLAAQKAQEQLAERNAVIRAVLMKSPPKINGKLDEDEWIDAAALPDDDKTELRIGYNDEYLFLCWSGIGRLDNSGDDYRRYFKTGACLDLQFSVDSTADPRRQQPVAGDQRLLITFVENLPQVVQYLPFDASAPADEAWETFTPAGGTTRFDRVRLLKGIPIARTEPQSAASNVVEVAIPLKTLGLRPRDGLRTKLDWGVLTTDDGNSVRQRLYWTNSVASGTTDEALEARLEPHLWGEVLFSAKSSDVDLLDRAVKSKPADPAAELLEELNKKK